MKPKRITVSSRAAVGAKQGERDFSGHATAAEAFREIDWLASEMVRTGAPSDAVELVVVNAAESPAGGA